MGVASIKGVGVRSVLHYVHVSCGTVPGHRESWARAATIMVTLSKGR